MLERPRPGFAGLLVVLTALAVSTACSPIYVVRAGWAELKILRAREPLGEVMLDSTRASETREQLTWALEARTFAREQLGFDFGDTYSSFVQLESDTLALILSAAPVDQLQPKTWWFPIVGRVPYRGYFDLDDALRAEEDLIGDGYDTWLRPTAAFSTLGWFSDPILSTFLDREPVELVSTIIHELTHVHLFIGGHVRFNESFAQYVGLRGAADFFCNREGSGPRSVKCARAEARLRDAVRFSRFLDGLVVELEAVYAEAARPGQSGIVEVGGDERLDVRARRDEVLARHISIFRDRVQPTFEASTYSGFLSTPVNNATLLSRMRYYHRLGDFDALRLRQGGGLREFVEFVARAAPLEEDPFALFSGR